MPLYGRTYRKKQDNKSQTMPNQRDPNKKMLAIWANKSLQKRIEAFVNTGECKNKSEAITLLLNEALKARKF